VSSNVIRRAVAAGQGSIFTGKGKVGAITLKAAAGNAAFVDLRDATAALGTKYIHEITALAGDTVSIPLHGLEVTNGVYCETITGTGAVLYVELL